MNREAVFAYAKEKYDTMPDYPFPRDWVSAVLRNKSNSKWYAILMRIPRNRLGIDGDKDIDVMNVKCITDMTAYLHTINGIFPAYHMNKKNWVSIILDGTVPRDIICNLIDESYSLVEKN